MRLDITLKCGAEEFIQKALTEEGCGWILACGRERLHVDN